MIWLSKASTIRDLGEAMTVMSLVPPVHLAQEGPIAVALFTTAAGVDRTLSTVAAVIGAAARIAVDQPAGRAKPVTREPEWRPTLGGLAVRQPVHR